MCVRACVSVYMCNMKNIAVSVKYIFPLSCFTEKIPRDIACIVDQDNCSSSAPNEEHNVQCKEK